MKTVVGIIISITAFTLILAGLYTGTMPYHVAKAQNGKKEQNETTISQEILLSAPREISKKPLLPTSTELIYQKYYVELPLAAEDYYYGKYINATVAVKELNNMPVLQPGDKIQIITDNYLTFGTGAGYIKPGEGFYYASGVCWTVSTLGMEMDVANKEFRNKYGIDLFTFEKGDRYPHSKSYKTYASSNNGYGYTVAKTLNGASPDYTFTVNPKLANDARFENLQIRIVLGSSSTHPTAYKGQVISAHIETNIDF